MINVPIKNDEDYRAALSAIDGLMDAEADTPDGEKLDALAEAVENYETEHFPIELPEPAAAVPLAVSV
jgi:HTH-type transcriptional regulator/antitoxin HigA